MRLVGRKDEGSGGSGWLVVEGEADDVWGEVPILPVSIMYRGQSPVFLVTIQLNVDAPVDPSKNK